jgi:hypothetical protein
VKERNKPPFASTGRRDVVAREPVRGADSPWRGDFGHGTEGAEPEQAVCGRNAAFGRPLRTFYSAASTLPPPRRSTRLAQSAVLERASALARRSAQRCPAGNERCCSQKVACFAYALWIELERAESLLSLSRECALGVPDWGVPPFTQPNNAIVSLSRGRGFETTR